MGQEVGILPALRRRRSERDAQSSAVVSTAGQRTAAFLGYTITALCETRHGVLWASATTWISLIDETESTPQTLRFCALRRAQVAIAFIVLIAMAPAARAACTDFAAAVSYSAGFSAQSVAIGDFNGDGRPDLATANAGSNNVTVRLGNADGTFGPKVSLALGNSPTSVTAGDFDGDGKLDLAVTISSDNNVAILLGNGSGGFGPAVTTYANPTGPHYVVAGDFDRDGKLDLAVANGGSNDISILLGNGSGGFGPATNVAAGTYPESIAIGDFDGDGTRDLAVANFDSHDVSILLGNGSGGFGAAVSVSIPATPPALVASPTSVTTADLNGDGKLDLAVTDWTSGRVAILLGNGAGSFGAATTFAVGTAPNAVVAGDFNGDGKPDLAVANYNSGTVSILAGNGSGSFALAFNEVTSSPIALAVADFNGDGKPDLASAEYGAGLVSILLNRSACFANCGAYGNATSFGGFFGGSSVAAGDFNRDGKLDVAVANGNGNNVTVLLGSGDGSFGLPSNPSAGALPMWVAIADFNSDGKLDLAVASHDSDSVSILMGDGNGGFGTAASFPAGTSPSGPQSLAVGDFNRDGKPDIAVTCGTSKELSILINTATPGFGPSFASAGNLPVGSGLGPRGVSTGDFNGDGRLDLAIADFGDGVNASNVVILLGNGSGGFALTSNPAIGIGPEAVGIGDFDGDGNLDLAVPNFGSSNVSILLGNGSGGFGPAVSVGAGANPSAIAAGDLDNDGKLDLAVTNSGGGNVSILLGNGGGGFTAASPAAYAVGGTPSSVAAADLDGDGKPDLAIANSNTSANVSILLNSCPPPDLTVIKNHIGTFTQGDTGRQYTIAAYNIAAVPTGGLVRVTDTLPAGLTATAIGGVGWNCTLGTLICTRSDSLASGGGYPPIGLAVSVASNAAASVTNTATVWGGGEVNSANDSSTDPTTILPMPDLTLTKTHIGNFTQGQTGASYTITVNNIGGAASSGTVTVTDTLPAGLTATAMGGIGWSCLPSLTCSRSNSLPSGVSYPSITLTVNVANDAAATVTNSATVSGGAQLYTGNDTATNPTTINQFADLTVTKTHAGTFAPGQTGASYTITVNNSGGGPTSGTVSVTDTLPTGLTATAISGIGWGCTLGTRTCTRNDVLASAGSYPAITLTVNVASDAPALVTNTVTVSGGGELITGNDSASDPTGIIPVADLIIIKSHTGNFTQGQMFRTYTLLVTNLGPGLTDGTVTVTDTLPAGLTLTTIGGPGWTCAPAIVKCTRSDVLAASGSYQPIKLTVNVAGNAQASVTNTATVSGGGELNTANDISSDLTTVSPGATNCGRFAAAVNYPSLNNPQSVAIGDFNGDGNGDLAVANNLSPGTVAILLGNGNGTFAGAVSYGVGNGPTSVALGDFNGDGKLDIAVANASSNNVSILLGVGDGTFASAVNYNTGTLPNAVAVGDFNGDGKLDLAAANKTSNNLSMMLGNGNGTFAPAVSQFTNAAPTALASGDFNRDGRTDIAVTSQGASTVLILLGSGNGTFFADGGNYYVNADPRSVVVGDFDNDGKLDLAVANLIGADVTILLGNGDGSFGSRVDYTSGTGTFSVTAADLDHDGKLDLAVANAGGVSILPGIGDGSFGSAVNYAAGTSPLSVAAGDFNGDGKPDLAVANSLSNNVSILLSACADLTITKSHTGNFTQGQTGASYSLTVSNSGPVATGGTVTVTDNLPAGLTAGAMGGIGWTCSPGTLTCTESDVLPAGASYPVITVTVNVNSNAAGIVTNSASVSGRGDTNTANDTASDPTAVDLSGLVAPTRLVATATSTSQISVVWDAVTTAVSYRVYRKDPSGPFVLVGTPSGATFPDSGLTGSTTYLYQVFAVNGSSTVSPPSNVDLATSVMFTDDPVVAGSTVIKAVHLTQLRTAVDAVRAAAGMANATYTNVINAGALIKAVDVTELRSNLDAARSTLGLPETVYVDLSLPTGITVKAAHVQDIRTGTK